MINANPDFWIPCFNTYGSITHQQPKYVLAIQIPSNAKTVMNQYNVKYIWKYNWSKLSKVVTHTKGYKTSKYYQQTEDINWF